MDARLDQANQLRLANDFDGARAVCRAVLEADPANAGALGLMGVCAIECGDPAEGRTWLDRAETADPGSGLVHLYRSILHDAEGDAGAALAAARRASELAPDRFDVWGRLGDLAGRAGDFETSAQAFDAALAADPEHPAGPHVALRLAAARIELMDLAAAAAALDIAEAGGLAGMLDVLRLRAELARHAGDWEALLRYAESWMELAPEDPEARGALALAWGRKGYYRKAVNLFEPVLSADPDNAANWAAQGRLILGARDISGARSAFDRALQLDPDCAEATFGLARVHTFLGDIDAAARMCRRTLAIDPGNLEAYGQLSEVSGGKLTDEEVARLETETGNPRMPADRLSIGLFALGDAYHRRKRPEDAFRAWSRANDTKKLQHNGAVVSAYDPTEQERLTDWLIASFAQPVGEDDEAEALRLDQIPVFIVGMPRSGTTLIEAAVSAHEDAAAGGEMSVMPVIFDEFVEWARESGWSGGRIPQDRLEGWRRRYLAQYADPGLQDARWITDKQPPNFLAVGLIRQLFPQAPVIHIRRKPVEVGFSIFRRNFSRMWPYAHDLEDIAHYYAQQARLGAHWPTVWPDRVTPLQYETLVEDFERQLRYVISRCGMSWSRRCLEYYDQERSAVMTFSAVQVRKPPSPQHLDSTSPYGAMLDPFREALAAHPVDPDTGVWTGVPDEEGEGAHTAPGKTPSKGLGGLFRRMLRPGAERDAS
jgi:tetratricopeptide (TPR) repeat protein